MSTVNKSTFSTALTASIRPAESFGMWQAGTTEYAWSDPADRGGDGQQEIDAFLETSRDNGFDIEETNELDGIIYFASPEQAGATVYKATQDGSEPQYFLLWIAERAEA